MARGSPSIVKALTVCKTNRVGFRGLCMPSVEMAKRALAVLILICFFLPIAQCSQQQSSPTESV